MICLLGWMAIAVFNNIDPDTHTNISSLQSKEGKRNGGVSFLKGNCLKKPSTIRLPGLLLLCKPITPALELIFL
jgi:hypothetical protein